MNIQTLTEEIQHKLKHLVSIQLPKHLKSIGDNTEVDNDTETSIFITNLTFDVSNKIIKEKLSKMNPKPLNFIFHIDREKYFEQTAKELMLQINEEIIYFDHDTIDKTKESFRGGSTFDITFNGYFLEDYGYIGTKKILQTEEITDIWFPAILACLKFREDSDTDASETLNFIRDFVTFGFKKALAMENVFIDFEKMNSSLLSVSSISVGQNTLTPEQFIEFRKENKLGKN
ncbi:hypothetical protein GW796_00785 [archaeon]|nr:hypothetical protein [archaeon]NCQ50441.1 hypothetical protein [archaeon]